MPAVTNVVIKSGHCEICNHERKTTGRLILGPRGFRVHETCDDCYKAYQATGKSPFKSRLQASVTTCDTPK